MNRKITPPISEAIVQLQRQLDQFRSTQPRRTKLPESLWQAAVELARQHGIYPVAHPLLRRKATKPAFVELVAPQATALEECVIEFESASGGKMRIQWKASAPPDWVSLLRAWRETEG